MLYRRANLIETRTEPMSEILRIFISNEGGLRRHLRRYCARVEDIDDVLQETFLRGFAADLRSEIQQPKAYLYQIARNIALDRLRRNAVAPMESLEDLGGSSIILDDKQVLADDWLDGRQKLSLFAKAVAQLPAQCRKAFMMRHAEGLPYKQIATRMNISVSAVEKHVTLGLVKCDAYLRAHGYEPGEFRDISKLSKPAQGSKAAQASKTKKSKGGEADD